MLKSVNFVVFPAVLLAAACASATPSSLVDARAAYQRAAEGPAATLNPAQLHVAQNSLAVAEKTYEDEGSSANARDRAYVAQRKAELAEVQAGTIAANQKAKLAAERVEAAQVANQEATERNLSGAREQIANQKNVVANQRTELAGEKELRLQAERRAADAMAALAEVASVKQEPRGMVITLSGAVIFASGEAKLLPGAKAKLDQVAVTLMEGETPPNILIEGHTDSRGDDAMNQGLSERRAKSVKDYLVSKGFPAAHATSEGLGSTRPVAENDTAEGRANNRRVEIVVQPK